VVSVNPASPKQTYRAETRIGTTPEGVLVARILVRRSADSVELIAHELEHVVEKAEGTKFLFEAVRPGSGVSLSSSAFETQRAVEAGRRVAREVREETRTRATVDGCGPPGVGPR